MSSNWNSSSRSQRDARQNALMSPLLEPARMLKLYKDSKLISRVQHFMVCLQVPPELHIVNEMPVSEDLNRFPQFFLTVASENEEQVMEWQKLVSHLFHRQNLVAICGRSKQGQFFILPPPDVDCRGLSVICRPSNWRLKSSTFAAANPPHSQPPTEELQPASDPMPSYGDGDGSGSR